MSMSNYSQELSAVWAQLNVISGVVELAAAKLGSLQTEAQELISLVGQTRKGDTQALVEALTSISEAKVEATNINQPIGEAKLVVKRYMDQLGLE
jgi:septation ring formation regulator EzrA